MASHNFSLDPPYPPNSPSPDDASETQMIQTIALSVSGGIAYVLITVALIVYCRFVRLLVVSLRFTCLSSAFLKRVKRFLFAHLLKAFVFGRLFFVILNCFLQTFVTCFRYTNADKFNKVETRVSNFTHKACKISKKKMHLSLIC